MPELFCLLKRILPRPITLSVVATVSLLCGGGAAHAQAAIEASSASMAPGATSVATLSAQAPRLSPAFQAGFDRSHRSGPTNLPHAAPAVAAPAGAPVLSLGAAAPAAPTDFYIADSVVNPGGGLLSPVGEPSGDNAGATLFRAGNWYATASFDGGITWNYEDPFSLFGSGFCCDQVVVYDPGRNWWFWLLQYVDGHLVLANSGDLVNWCSYTWTPGSFGFTGELDYNDLALTTNDIYIVSNVFPSAGGMGSTIARVPIDPQVNCAGFNYNFFTRTDLGFTWKPVSGATDVLYWGTNWFGTLGSSFRVFKWPENTGTISWFDSTLSTTFTFYTRNSGQNCGSTDGVVANWCQYADSRVLGGARYSDPDGVARLVFSFNAGQGAPFGLPFPYTERVHFRESDIAYLSSDRLFSSNVAWQFMSMATDARGHIGMTTTYGGGTGGVNFYPSGAVFLNDDVAPSQPWQGVTNAVGAGNACNSGLYRWGDFLTTRPYRPTNLMFQGFNYILTADAGLCNVGAPAEQHQAVFGRTRDLPGALNRWYP
jgi:hypothetical protein